MSVKRLVEKLSIRNKIAAAFCVVLLLVGAVGFSAVDRLMTLNRTVNSLTQDSLVGIAESNEMREAMLRYRLAISRYVIAKNLTPDFDVAADKAIAGYQEHEAKFSRTAREPAELAILGQIRSARKAYVDAVTPAVALYHAGKLTEAWDLYQANDGVPKAEAVEAALLRAVEFNTQEAQRLTLQADSDYVTALWTIFGLMAAAVLLALGVGYGLVRTIAHPLVRSAHVLGQLAQRDYDFELRQAGRGDEIGELSRAMGKLRSALQEGDRLAAEQQSAQAAKARRQAAMEQHTQDFGNSISGVMASLAASAESMRRAAETMSSASGTVHAQAADTSTGAAKASQDLTAVAAAVEQLNASVGEISRQLAEAAGVAEQAVQRADSSHATMQGLSEATVRIGDVVRLISDIASQTNLLALNATIEAARAGDAGKGFAVVAGEVKTLAAQTAKATSEIATQIETVRSATTDAVSAMEDIAGIISKINGVSTAIASAVEQQSATTREIAASVQGVANATAGTAQAMEHVVSVSENAGTISNDVLSGAAGIGREAEKLRVEVDQFLAAVRDETNEERRRYERLATQGVMVNVQINGQAPARMELRNISRGGAAMTSDLALPAGAALQVDLPESGGAVPARVARCGDGELAVVFSPDPQALARIDRVLAALSQIRRAA